MRNVNSKFIAVGVCLALIGCSSLSTASRGTWRASDANGDKPGIGIELTRTSHGVSGFMYLLDPNKPGGFGAGSRRRMVIHEATEQELRFSVQWSPSQTDEMVLRLATPLRGSSVRGKLQSADGRDTATVYEFARTR
jgi:hypothetical protein